MEEKKKCLIRLQRGFKVLWIYGFRGKEEVFKF